ncbi:hypothetical protein Sjap_015712 [Stephania japonica]|uniref:Uncharacterized protein n=1 Tax=Stephania japonica TaxID=461633 RepID=A0AAP0IK40_9MAGN
MKVLIEEVVVVYDGDNGNIKVSLNSSYPHASSIQLSPSLTLYLHDLSHPHHRHREANRPATEEEWEGGACEKWRLWVEPM